MASIGQDSNGRKRILFVDGDTRQTIRLGKATMGQAEKFKTKVEALIGCKLQGTTPEEEVIKWLSDLDDTLHERVAAVGLVKSRSRSAATLKTFLYDYFKALAVKSGTETAYDHTRRYLLAYFGENRALRSIEPQDAEQFRQHLKASKLSESTIARRVSVARMMFKRAGKWKLISENPFADVKAGAQTNKARMFFVTRDMATAVLNACNNVEWCLLFALSRYGGLRCPSEHLALKWADVDWEKSRIRIPSCKTEHHEGGDCRYIPMFPELRPYLLEAFEQAEAGTEYVITKYRDTTVNLRTQLIRIIHRAGLKAWPKLWHNLRSSRQTELAQEFPLHIVCAWIGNSRAVAQDHYLQVRDTDFEKAIKDGTSRGTESGTANRDFGTRTIARG